MPSKILHSKHSAQHKDNANRVVIDLEENDISKYLRDERFIPHEVTNDKHLSAIVISIVLLVCFTVISIAQMIQWKPLDNFIAFQDIQRNFNNWQSILGDYQSLESNKIKTLIPSMNNYNLVSCIDYGTYYLPMFFNAITIDGEGLLLPAAVRRGNGDGWAVTKSSPNDQAALQQCMYIASELSDTTVTCGIDMYNKLGYGGYLNKGHWCNTARDLLYNYYRI